MMYIPLNIKTDYSLQRSLIKVKDLISFCVEKNIKVCGICDNNLSSSIEFYKLCKKNNIKPIIGLEITIDNKSVYLYCKNYDGYKNLLKINSLINDDNFNIDYIKDYLKNNIVVVKVEDKELINVFAEDTEIYFGITKDQLNIEDYTNLVAINDIRCFNKEDIKYLNILYNLSGSVDLPDKNDYFRSVNINNDEFVNKINIEIPFNNKYIPKFKQNIDSTKYLSDLANFGLNKRLNGNIEKKYQDRLNYELDVIAKMGFVDYFLIVYDYVLYAKKNNILVGPGRGSAAGSLVSYSLGITDIDPIKYNLLFERFLNVDRVTMPDIDIDFDNTKRDEVINYVKNKYGKYRVSGGITFSTYKTRLVLRDVAKYLEIKDEILNKFLSVLNKDLSLKENLNNKLVKKYLNEYFELNNLYMISMKLEGLKKNISQNAAGIVISDRELDEIIPMYFNKDVMLTGVSMEYLEDMGLLKMDFLALKNLSTIASIIENIPDFDIKKINLEDQEVYKLFSSANTDGIFQFETPTFKRVLPKLKPKCFNDLIASISLIRPGPSRELETYIKRKDGNELVTYYDERLKDILEETYGIIIYQEQVIRILNKMANFTNQEADTIRRAMSKKKKELLVKYKEEFIKRSIKNNYTKEISEIVFEHILSFASYGFNKAHSVSYALISYQMAYLKVHYKYLFIFSLLNEIKGNDEKTKKYLIEIKNDGIKLVKPSWNYSSNEFLINNKFLYLPYKMIKGLTTDKINLILDEKRKGSFTSVFDVFKRTNSFLNKKNYELLIKADMFKEFKINNNTLLNNLDNLINYGVLSLDIEDLIEPEIAIYEEMCNDDLRMNEKNIFGFYISNHPASKYISKDFTKIENLNRFLFKNIKVAVIIENVKKIKTKKGEEMAFMSASDETGSIEFAIFPTTYRKIQNIKKDDFVIIIGEVTKRFDKISVVVNKIEEV